MVALTLIPPWGDLIAANLKDIENRTWKPGLRPGDWIAIHNGARHSPQEWQAAREVCQMAGYEFPKGLNEKSCRKSAIIAVARYAELVKPGYDAWAFGPECWLFDKVIRLDDPIPATGALKLWHLDEAIANQLTDLIRSSGFEIR